MSTMSHIFKKTKSGSTQTASNSITTTLKSGERPLDKIIDFTQPFRMIYSGVENSEYFKILYDLGIRNFLMSYHYLLGKKANISMYKEKGVKFFIDSGAFTFMGSEEYAKYTIEQWEKQIDRYLNWARNNKDIIFAIADLDLHHLVGTQVVQSWRKKYFEPFMLETGIPVCFVWHEPEGFDGWERMCERYPYVGISWVSDKGSDYDFNFGQKMVKVAQKYKAVIHGFGMTRTALLPQLPFYTVDSTTWLVGLKYGELNFWTGKSMKRLKKTEWNEYKAKIQRTGVDFNKLKAEDNTELIRANIIPFIEAEQYIQTRLRAKMYWLKQDVQHNDLDSADLFPPYEWLRGKTEPAYDGWKEYAEKLNISTVDEDFAINAIIDCSVFSQLEWVDEGFTCDDDDILEFFLTKYHATGIIPQLHEEYVNEITEDDVNIKVRDLINFFKAVAKGEETKLLYHGTSFGLAKERDSYVTEDEYDLVDLTPEQVTHKLAGILPAPKDEEQSEILDLDDEIFNNLDIVPVRDESGKFLKGQLKVRKPKNIYSEKYPKLVCDTCYAAQNCPGYKQGYVCAYKDMFKRFDTRNIRDIIEAMQGMANMNLERLQIAALFEKIDGGMPDAMVSNLIDQNIRILTTMDTVIRNANTEVLRKTTIQKSDGSMEETVQVSNPREGGILEKWFTSASTNSKSAEDEDYIDVEPADEN